MCDQKDHAPKAVKVLHRHHLLDLLDNHGHDDCPLGVDHEALASVCQDL